MSIKQNQLPDHRAFYRICFRLHHLIHKLNFRHEVFHRSYVYLINSSAFCFRLSARFACRKPRLEEPLLPLDLNLFREFIVCGLEVVLEDALLYKTN